MTASRLDILARLDEQAPWFDWPAILDDMNEAGLVVDTPNFDTVPQPTTRDDQPGLRITGDYSDDYGPTMTYEHTDGEVCGIDLAGMCPVAAEALVAIVRDHAAVTPLWTCPDCAFTYAAEHTDTATGENSCPVCAEAAVTRERDTLRAVVQRLWDGEHIAAHDYDAATLDEFTSGVWRATEPLSDDQAASIRAALGETP